MYQQKLLRVSCKHEAEPFIGVDAENTGALSGIALGRASQFKRYDNVNCTINLWTEMKNDDSSKSWRELIQKTMEQQRRWQDSIEKVSEPQRIMQQQIDKILEPQRRWQEYIDRFLEPQRSWQKQIDKILEPQRHLQEWIDKLLEPQKMWQEHLDKILEPQRRLQEQINSLIEPEKKWREILEKYLSNMESIKIDPSGAISFGTQSYTANEISAELDALGQQLSTASTFKEIFNSLFAYLERIGRPLAHILLAILIPYIVAIIANVTTPIYEEWWSKYSGRTKQEITKSITEHGLAIYDIEQLRGHRFVLARSLHVRSGPSTNDEIVDKLSLGKVVGFLEKEKGWFLIEYYSEIEDRICKGWVFSKYLAKFTK